MSTLLKGRVESGFGLARDSLSGVLDVLSGESGIALVPGTLNLRLDQPFLVVPDFVVDAGEHEHHETLLVQRCRVEGLDGLIVRTSAQARGESHALDVVEVMAGEPLRERLGLADGDLVALEVERVV